MRLPRTLYLYIAREIVLYGALAFAGLISLLVSQNLYRRLGDLVTVGFAGSDLARLIGHLVPMILANAAPIAFLFGVSLAVARLSSDSEVSAMQANGLGLRDLMIPPLVLGCLVSALTALLVIHVEPRAQRDLRTMFKTVATRGGLLEAGRFRILLGRVIFVESRDRENRLRGIMISDETRPDRPFMIFAERGVFRFDDEQELVHLSLENGTIHVDGSYLKQQQGDDDRYQRIGFRSLSYVFDVSAVLSGKTSRFRPREMSLDKLRENLARVRSGGDLRALREKEPIKYELEIHRRFALPLAPLLFAFVAVPLAVRRSRSARSFGTLITLGLAFGYYALHSFTEFTAEAGWTSAIVALWTPNIVLAAVGLGLLRRAARGGRA